MTIDRSAAARLMAQAIAYLNCGKTDAALRAAQALVDLLRAAGLQVR